MANGFIDHLQVVTRNDYNTIAVFHSLHSLHLKPSPACCVFTSRSLATASNSGDSSDSALTSLLPSEYPTTELQRHLFFSVSLAELNAQLTESE
jgi:hypothetical protein